MREYQFTIPSECSGMRVDSFLRRYYSFSTRTLTRLKRHPLGLLRNGVHVRTVDILQEGDLLSVHLEEEETEREVFPSRTKVEILYEDSDLMIYNKPPDMPCHTSCGHYHDTLENVYAAHCLRNGIPGRLRALNRLDRDTSGCVLVAKNQFVASLLTGHFEKTYRAIVCGDIPSDGRVEGRIFRPDPVDLRRIVDPRGQVAITEYGVLKRSGEYTYLQFRLLTGRTHQIRVHMASLGHPVLGDTLYGNPSSLLARQALHCHSLSLTHPITGVSIKVTAPLPADLQSAYDQIFTVQCH